MAEITYVTGDATAPEGDGLKVIVHCCNNLGVWGAGVVMALSRKWERPEAEYKAWANKYGEKFRRMLGSMLLVPVEEDIIVANLVGQEGVGKSHDGTPPVRYEAIFKGLTPLQTFRDEKQAEISVHMPRMGCGLAGGEWHRIEEILAVTLNEHDIPVTVYDLPE